VLWPMFPLFLDYRLLITLCVLSNVYLLQYVQCVVANGTFVPRLFIVDYPLCFVLPLFTTVCSV
jgi:hypothetical protein